MRRIATAGVLVAILLAGVFVTRRLIDDGSASPAEDASAWNAIAVLTGNGISVRNRAGTDEVATYSLATDPLDDQSLTLGSSLITVSDDGTVVLTDLGDGSAETGQADSDATLHAATDHPSFALVASDIGGDVTIVDADNGTMVSIAEATDISDPLIFASDVFINPAGSHVAVAIPRLFQSFVIDLERSEATALAGRVLAIDDDRVVTEQPAGDNSEIEFYALDGERLGSVDVAAPKASMITAGGSMLLVAGDGAIAVADSNGDEDVGALEDPDGRAIEITGGARSSGGDRLVATAENAVYVVDADGKQRTVIAGRLAMTPTVASECVVVATGTSTIGVTVVDLETGDTVGEVEQGFVTATSTDGCTVATSSRRSPQVIRNGETIDVNADAIVAVAPDGSAYVVIDGRRTSLVTDTSDPVLLVSEPAIIRFGRR
jgi:hypothetical protein